MIFPQRSGPLEIPDILFRGEVTDGSSNFVFRNLNTRRVTAFIEGITIDVNERPAGAEDLDNWLPVTNLSIGEEWSAGLNDLKVGDSLVRTITLVADGLDGAVLPPFGPEAVSGMNVYPDPASIDRTYVDGSIVGTRVETSTLVPVVAGAIEIPEISIPWWDVTSDVMKTAVIPATTIQVATIEGDVPSELSEETSISIEELLAETPTVDQEMIDAQEEQEFIEIGASWLAYIMALSLLIVVFSLYKLLLQPNKKELAAYLIALKEMVKDKYSAERNESIAFNQLRKACSKRDLNKIKQTLIVWCNHYVPHHGVKTIESILQQLEWSDIHPYIIELQDELYFHNKTSEYTSEFSNKDLIRAVATLRRLRIRENKLAKITKKYSLPPLYKAV